MDLGSIIGLIVGVGGVLMGFILEGGDAAELLSSPSAMIIVFGGTFGAVILSFPVNEIKQIFSGLGTVFKEKKMDPVGIINHLSELSEKARKEGLLSLEMEAQNSENEFIRKGLSLVVDGIETEVIKDILDRELELRESTYEKTAKIFESAGGYAPTMGVLGTVMGMINVLGTMNEDPSGLGKRIATAFLATMFGVGTANLIFIPIATRIKAKAASERMVNDLIIEGLLSIQAGENPRIIKEKLNLTLIERMNGKGGSKKGAPAAEAETGAEAEG